MDLTTKLGLNSPAGASERLARKANLQLVAGGLPAPDTDASAEFTSLASGLLASYRQKSRLLADHRCPADQRIEDFLNGHFADLQLPEKLRLPGSTLVLDQHGIAREVSLPAGGNHHASELLESYRVRNGVLHNPRSDRRTTEGTFHVTEGGLPVPGDKKAVPKNAFAEMFRLAMNPPAELLTLPFTAKLDAPARCFASLLLRPIVCPDVPGFCPEKTMEVRFFAPGSLVSNLDFVESIFGNAGDPYLPENDAGLDVEHWTGHTGCVVLAPHLLQFTKKQLGLPHVDQATARQKRDKMCYADEKELYNDGMAFKLTCRTVAGVIVTLIADNYYGYCKKEVKTQISYAANLYGNVEEEHAGGAIAFPSYALGDEYHPDSQTRGNNRTFAEVVRDFGPLMDLRPQGYGVDKNQPDLIYVPETSQASIKRQQIWWTQDGVEQAIALMPGKLYMYPSGFKIRIAKHPGAPSWRLIGTMGEGTFCHKPCTVSGGGKSEISKSLRDYMLYGPIFTADAERDLDLVQKIFEHRFEDRWKPDAPEKPDYSRRDGGRSRPVLSPRRSLGSLIKLLTPSDDFTDEYNGWLASIPNYIYPIVFIIKRFYKEEWGDNWRNHFGVDIVNGFAGNVLKLDGRALVGTYLRVGLLDAQQWRTFKLRQDFIPATKIQTEDDISASVVVPASDLDHLNPGVRSPSYKFVTNCESRLFQRPDDAVHRGLDKQTEIDMARADNFISNFEPLKRDDVRDMIQHVAEFEKFTQPMQEMLRGAVADGSAFVVSSANPRLIGGKPSKNPRYLQIRPDLVKPLPKYAAEVGVRLARAVPLDKPVHTPVNAVLVGRRNNPPEPEANIRGLAIYNPIHYQELPELFMDFISSLTGKSPSTTGAGSEGALTKSPFNAVRPTVDLNNALVSYILTGLAGFSTAAGHVGPNMRMDHDISLLVPEIWCRLSPTERDPAFLIASGMLEQLKDFDHAGKLIRASRLGYRITAKFVQTYFGRIFDNPGKVFDDEILKPELQDMESFIDGVNNITEAHQRVAKMYFDIGSIDDACPPLQAIITIMYKGEWEGKTAQSPEFRKMFSREALLASDWYKERLKTKQKRDIALWERHVSYLESFGKHAAYGDESERLGLQDRVAYARKQLEKVRSADYAESLVGTLGADPLTEH